MAAKKRPLLKAKSGPKPNPVSVTATPVPGQTPTAAMALGKTPAGRPPSNIGNYLLKPTADVDSGFEVINTDPNVLKRVHANFLKKGELPPALQPKYLRKPEVMDHQRANAISRGWRKPRSQQG